MDHRRSSVCKRDPKESFGKDIEEILEGDGSERS